jgi:hypothetical protein
MWGQGFVKDAQMFQENVAATTTIPNYMTSKWEQISIFKFLNH